MVEAPTTRRPQKVELHPIHTFHLQTINEFQATQIGKHLVGVAMRAVPRRMFVEHVPNKGEVAQILSLPVGAGGVRGGEGGVEGAAILFSTHRYTQRIFLGCRG